MLVRTELKPLELRLLLRASRIATTEGDAAEIRHMLERSIDWTRFAQKAVDHGLAGLAGHTLARVAPDLVPQDILDALSAIVTQTRNKNGVLFDELSRILQALSDNDIDAIPIKGPVLALLVYGDIGLRTFRDLDFLIRDRDRSVTISTLIALGYERKGELTAPQFDLIHRLQGQEVMFKRAAGTAAEPHTRLTSMKMAVDIDYGGLWSRAQRLEANGRSVLSLSPEDNFVVLAIHGGKEMWWNIKWACDMAAFIAAFPALNWDIVIERAREQGCLRMVLLATALTRQFFDASLPAALIALGRDDPAVESMAARILALWRADEPAGPPSYKTLSMDRLRLHDGFRRRTNYVARTLFLPTPQHVEMIALPRALGFAYVPLKLAHDFIALPPWRAYKMASAQTGRMRKAFANSSLGVALTPKARETAQSAKFHHRERANIQRAIARTPDKAANWRNYATEMLSAGRQGDALSYVDKALALDPRDSRAWAIRARALSEAMRYGEAVVASDTALALDPANIAARRIGIHAQLFACDWRRRDENDRQIVQSIERGERVITPFNHRALSNSESEGLALARVWSKQFPAAATPLWRGERYTHDKIRVAYVSTDFRDHVVTVAIAGCFERHDRTKFEVTAISLGPNDGSEMRGRLEAVFDRFIDAETLGDHAVAQTLRELEIDVAVDLNGYSGDKRTGIFAHRAAPVQVNYLGYPGTMGLPYFDYVVADRVAIPPENQSCYSEKVVYLPDTFIPTDRTRPIADVTTSRVEAGLPETGFVFACHNTSYKIGPRIFDIWMRLLTAVEGSVLWLASANASAIVNLRREAQSRGVDPERLVFATRVPRREDHLARLRLADLFLDTTPYNAHSTAADALWAGLPLLTYLGSTFPARVAASLLYAIDLPELVTATLEEYEQRALALALDRDMLASIRAKLLRNRLSTPLFDTIRYTRNLEAAFGIMVERQRAGFAPESFAVER